MLRHPDSRRAGLAAPTRVRVLFVIATGVLAGCAGDAHSAGNNDLDASPVLSLTEVMRIGSVDDPDYGFTSIQGVDVDRDGNVYVFEGVDAQIRVYSPDGELLRRIGRRGEGPGEFRGWARFGLLGDTLWAIETSSRRVSLFRRDGTVISTSPIQSVLVPMPRSLGHVMPALMRSDGLFTSDMTMFSSSREMEITVSENDTVQVPRVLFDATGAPVDTVGWMPRPPDPVRSSIERVEVGGNRYSVPRPPGDEPLAITLPDGWLVVDRRAPGSATRATLTVTRLDVAGDTMAVHEYSYTARPFDDAALDMEAWNSARVPGMGIPIINGVPTPPPPPDDSLDVFNRIREQMSFPAFQPPITSHRLFASGIIWLLREDDGGPTRRWTLLTDDGRLVGDVVFDRTVWPIWSDTETFFVAERDEFDVPWLVRYRMTASPG